MEDFFLMRENSVRGNIMNDFVVNGHVGGYKLGITLKIMPFPNKNIPVENKLPLFVGSHQTKTQEIKFIHMCVHKKRKNKE